MFCPDAQREARPIEGALFVDPGLGGTGWAYFQGLVTKAERACVKRQDESGVLKSAKSEREGSWIGHAHDVESLFLGTLAACKPRVVVLEQPMLWSGSATSHASASTKGGEAGDLFKLSYLVGLLGSAAKASSGSLPILIMPHEWKGQLSKELVLERLAEFGIEAKDHEADAIGMGIAAQGLL